MKCDYQTSDGRWFIEYHPSFGGFWRIEDTTGQVRNHHEYGAWYAGDAQTLDEVEARISEWEA